MFACCCLEVGSATGVSPHMPVARLRTGKARVTLLSAAALPRRRIAEAASSGYLSIASTLTLSTGFTRLFILVDYLMKPGAVWHQRDALSVLLLAGSVSLSALVTTFALLEKYYADVDARASSEGIDALDAQLQGRIELMRIMAKNALWASLLLLLASVWYRVSAVHPLAAAVLAAGMTSVVATVGCFRAAYGPAVRRMHARNPD